MQPQTPPSNPPEDTEPSPPQGQLSNLPGASQTSTNPSVDTTQPDALVPENQPPKPHQKHWVLKALFITATTVVLLVLILVGWIYSRHLSITFGSKNKDIPAIKAAVFEGDMSQFAPKLSDDDATLYLNRQIFEGLVRFEDKTKITPLLATSWTNPDDMTWIFTLKQGVKFHTGNVMSAKDVVYSYDQLKQDSSFSYVFSTIKSVEAIGNDEVKITTNSVDPVLINRLTDMFIIDSSAAGKADPIYGTGPYMLKPGTTATPNQINLVAFNDYHGGHIYTKELQVNVYSDQNTTATALGFLKGNLNLIGFVPSSVAQTAKTLRFTINSRDDPSVYQLAFNTLQKDSPLANLKVRQAIYQTIDVPALLEATGRNETGTIANQVTTQLIPGYNPDIQRPARDLNRARELLKEAGYPNGTSFTLTVFTAAQDAGTEIARQLSEVGIHVKLDVRTDTSQLVNDLKSGNLQSFYYAEGSSIVDGSDVFQSVAQGHNYRNPAIDKLMVEANSTFNQPERLDDLKQISKIIADDVAVVPLYTNNFLWITDKAYDMPQDLLSNGLGVYVYKVQLP